MKFKVALQVYSVRTDLQNDFYGTLEKVKAMGFDGVEFAGFYDHEATDIKKFMDGIGLKTASAHISIDEQLKNPEKIAEDMLTLGAKYVAVPYLMPERRPGTPGFDRTIEDIRKLAELYASKGLTLLYHNHDFEFQKVDGVYALEKLYNSIPAELLKTQLDLCWVNVGGEDPAKYLCKFKDRAPVVHYKDFYKRGEADGALYGLIGVGGDEKKATKFELRPVGYGCQNWPAIIDATEYVGAEWVIAEQDEPSMGRTRLECAEMSANYLKEILK